MIYLIFIGTIGLIAWILYAILSPIWKSDRADLTRWQGLVRSRNFFLLGFIYFQLYGAAYFLLLPWDFESYLLFSLERAHFLFLLYATLFLASFSAAYRITGRKFTVPRLLVFEGIPSLPVLWASAIVVALLSLSLRFALVVPIVGPALNHWLSVGSAVACGLAAFAWGRNIGNPVSILVLGFTLSIGLINVILTDFGRRNLVAQAIAVVVCTWLSGCMHRRLKQTTIAVAIMGVAGIVLLAAFTQARSDRVAPRGDRLGFLFSDFNVEAILQLGVPGDTAPASLWLIDSHPQSRGFETETLYSARYFFWHYAPRSMFPDKPEPLSVRIPEMARFKNVAVGTLTIGPGLMGHVAHDGGWWVAITYGVILGIFFGMVDTFLMNNIYRPFAAAAVVCAYGQIFGLARGESPVFLGIACIALIGWIPILRGLDLLAGRTRT